MNNIDEKEVVQDLDGISENYAAPIHDLRDDIAKSDDLEDELIDDLDAIRETESVPEHDL
jgi:hypothetical protein